MKIYILALIALILSTSAILSQNNNQLRTRYGIYGSYNINMHSANFNKLDGIANCCPSFKNGSGTGFSFGLLFESPIGSKFLYGIRVGYTSLNGLLSETETTMLFDDDPSHRIKGEFEHTIDATISDIGLEAYLGYMVTNSILCRAGLRVGFTSVADFEQKETTSHGTFIGDNGEDTGLSVRNEYSGEIPNAASTHLSALFGIAYELPLNKNKTWILAPEISFYLGLSDLVDDFGDDAPDDLSWKVNSLNLGFALKYSPKRSIRTSGESIFDVDISAFGVDKEGNEQPIVKITIEEFSSLELHPLLNYIFFDKDSYIIPERYEMLDNNEKKSFKEVDLYKMQTLEIYYHVMNIICKRLVDNPKEKITLVGCNDDNGSEEGNKNLSKNRVNQVKEYFTDTWGINPNRIKTEIRNLPKKPSNIKEDDGIEENRRVEIHSNYWEIMKPVICFDTLRVPDPQGLRFYPKINTDESVNSWNISADQNAVLLKEFNGSDMPDESYYWDLNDNMPVHSDKLIYYMSAENDADFQDQSDIKTIPVEILSVKKKRSNRIKDKEVQKFSLILFDFNKSTLSSNNKKIVDLIKDRISGNSKVYITGHTDRIGDESSNKILSQKRANSTKKALNFKRASAIGNGESDLLYENDLPEKRFYCRTVNVVVETIFE